MDYIYDLRGDDMTNGGSPHKKENAAQKPVKTEVKEKPSTKETEKD